MVSFVSEAVKDEDTPEIGTAFSMESNGPSDSYAAIAQVDSLRAEPESLRKWREEQNARLEQLDSASKAAEAEWKEKAMKELENWHVHQNEQMEKNKASNRFEVDLTGDIIFHLDSPGHLKRPSCLRLTVTAQGQSDHLCDFNPKTNKTAKDVSRMRSVLIALKRTPLVR